MSWKIKDMEFTDNPRYRLTEMYNNTWTREGISAMLDELRSQASNDLVRQTDEMLFNSVYGSMDMHINATHDLVFAPHEIIEGADLPDITVTSDGDEL